MYIIRRKSISRVTRLFKSGVWLLLSFALCSSVLAGKSSEAPLRVAFVFNFIKFIEWPEHDASQNVKLCVYTSDADTRSALQQLNGKTANKRVIELIYLKPDELGVLNQCHMLYITQSILNKHLPSPLPNGVVLVADEPTEQDHNVSIALLRNNDGRIEFAINSSAVDHAGVNISSQLLKLAKNSRKGKG